MLQQMLPVKVLPVNDWGMQAGSSSAVPCECVELTGNQRPWIRWLQVGVHVRGLVVCPIVCGENTQMNNQPAVSLESTTVYHNLPSSLSPPQPVKLCLFLFPTAPSPWFHQEALSSRILPHNSLCIYSIHAIFFCSLTSINFIHLLPPLSPPLSLLAPPLLTLFLTLYPLLTPSLQHPSDNMRRFTIIITLITLSLLSTPISLLHNEENCRSSGRSLCELNRSKQAFTHSSPPVKSTAESSTTDVWKWRNGIICLV